MIDVKFILFVAGSAGNFLARTLTLDPQTVNLGKDAESVEQRLEQYRYDNKFQGMKYNKPLPNGLSNWVDQELNYYYFPFTRGFENLCKLNKIVIEPIHPHHFDKKISLLGKDDLQDFWYIDPADCESWIIDQRSHKIDYYRADRDNLNRDIILLNDLVRQYNIKPISLKRILNDSFIDEYQKICSQMSVAPYIYQANIIYNSWKQTWKM